MTRLATHIVLSTAHLAGDVAALMSDMEPEREGPSPYSDWRSGIACLNHAYGYWVRAMKTRHDPEEYAAALDALPESLAACLRFADRFGCTWIMFDRDEPEVEELARYEW